MTDLSIKNMTTAEKLSVMEALWNDLCEHDQVESPEWHGEVLAHRDQRRQSGEQQPMDWNEAKESIRQRIR